MWLKGFGRKQTECECSPQTEGDMGLRVCGEIQRLRLSESCLEQHFDKVKNSLDSVNAAVLAQIDLSCALLHPLTRSHTVLTLLPNTSALKLLHSSSSFTTKCLP